MAAWRLEHRFSTNVASISRFFRAVRDIRNQFLLSESFKVIITQGVYRGICPEPPQTVSTSRINSEKIENHYEIPDLDQTSKRWLSDGPDGLDLDFLMARMASDTARMAWDGLGFDRWPGLRPSGCLYLDDCTPLPKNSLGTKMCSYGNQSMNLTIY